MNWRKFTEDTGEKPEDFFDDEALYHDSAGNRDRAKAIRARRRKIKDGEIEDE